jgi:ABC-2 type transport system ATP-binding protein
LKKNIKRRQDSDKINGIHMDSIITVRNLVKMYGEQTVLNMPHLDIAMGECIGIAGNNGAGKTTFFRLLLDLIQPTVGEIFSKNLGVSLTEEWKGYTGSFLDESFLIDYLTPDEYFRFVSKIQQIPEETWQTQLEAMEPLIFKGEIRGNKKLIRDLSKGNQKKVGVAAALLGNPEVVILDEPFANLDPSTQFQLREILRRLDEETGTTLLISSHDLQHIANFCGRIIILEKGDIVKDIATHEETLTELEAYFTGIQ